MAHLIASPVASPTSDSASASTPTSASTPASADSSSSRSTSLLSLTHLSSSPPPGAALAPPLKTYGTPAPLRERMRLVHALRITIPPVPEFVGGVFVGPQPWKVADDARRAKGAVQPTRANLPRRVKKTPSALAPASVVDRQAVTAMSPVGEPDAADEAKQKEEEREGQVEEEEEAARPAEAPPRTARSVAQPGRSNLPRRRAGQSSKAGKKKRTFFDSDEEREEEVGTGEQEADSASAAPRSAMLSAALPAERTGTRASCLQTLAPGLSVAFFDEDGGEDGEGERPPGVVVPEELAPFAHVVSVRCYSPPKRRRGRPADASVETPPLPVSVVSPSTNGAFPNARRLRLTIHLSTTTTTTDPTYDTTFDTTTTTSHSDAHLSAEQMRAALEFVRATPPGEDVLVTAHGLRPGDAAVLVALCVAADRRARDGGAWGVREVLREVDDESDGGVVGFWKGVVQEEVALVAEGVLRGEMRGERRRGGGVMGPAH